MNLYVIAYNNIIALTNTTKQKWKEVNLDVGAHFKFSQSGEACSYMNDFRNIAGETFLSFRRIYFFKKNDIALFIKLNPSMVH